MTTREQFQIVEIDIAAVQGLLERAKGQMRKEDHELLQGLVETLFSLMDLLRKGRTTLARLRRLVGMVSTEKTAAVLGKLAEREAGAAEGATEAEEGGEAKPAADKSAAAGEPAATETVGSPDTGDDAQAATKPKGHGRVPASDYPDATHIAVPHESLRPGDSCPACERGKLFALKEPARFLRIVGQAPLVAVCWDCERLRCSSCGLPYTARAPDEAQGDKHSETAAAMMALLRYGGGVPLNRLERLQHHLSTPVAASTQWDVVHARVSAVEPVYRELVRLAAQGSVMHNDDTYSRILEFMGKRRAKLLRQGALPSPERTGLFTTAIVSIVEAGRAIALFFTGRKHAGENLADLLHHRAEELDPPVLMCDALERNLPKGHKVVESNCASHGRRHFVDEAEN
ncbi:MAG: transposase, partial [Specibacter sp.]